MVSLNSHSLEITNREREILQNIVDKGFCTKRICADLCITANTVHTHRNRILLKLDVHNITDAVVEAIRRGIVEVKPKPQQ